MAARSTFGYRTIVVGVDFSPGSRRAVTHALRLGARMGSRVHLVYVAGRFQPALPFSQENREVVAQLRKEEAARAREALASLAEAHPDVQTRTAVRFGRPSAALLEYAGRVRADLLILANLGHSRTETVLIGSTAERVLRQATLPVLLVPVSKEAPKRAPATRKRRTRRTARKKRT